MAEALKAVGICGSPRKGNSWYLLKEALAAASDYFPELKVSCLSIGDEPMAPCDACMSHRQKGGECRIEDGFQGLRDAWLAAEVVIYSYPVYHMGIPAQLKAFIDRLGATLGSYFQSPGEKGYHLPRLMKVIGLITQGAHLFGGQDLALNFMLNHAVLMRCLPVAGDLPGSYVGAAGWTGGQIGKSSLAKLQSENDHDALIAVRSARQVGLRTVQTALIVRDGLNANRQALSRDPHFEYVLNRL